MAHKISIFTNDIPDDFVFSGSIAVDTEAMGLKIHRDRLCLVQICDEKGKIGMVHFPDSGYDYSKPKNLKALLEDKDRLKIFHYARFDVAILKKYLNIELIPNIFCTKIASRLARTYTDSHGLRSMLMDLIGVELKKEQQSSNWGSDTLTEAQKHYAANDVIYLHEAMKKLLVMLKKHNRLNIANKYFEFLDSVVETDTLGFEEDLFRHQ